jgi:hypothetical protein
LGSVSLTAQGHSPNLLGDMHCPYLQVFVVRHKPNARSSAEQAIGDQRGEERNHGAQGKG